MTQGIAAVDLDHPAEIVERICARVPDLRLEPVPPVREESSLEGEPESGIAFRRVTDPDIREHFRFEKSIRIGNQTANTNGPRRWINSRIDCRDACGKSPIRVSRDRDLYRSADMDFRQVPLIDIGIHPYR